MNAEDGIVTTDPRYAPEPSALRIQCSVFAVHDLGRLVHQGPDGPRSPSMLRSMNAED